MLMVLLELACFICICTVFFVNVQPITICFRCLLVLMFAGIAINIIIVCKIYSLTLRAVMLKVAWFN